MASWYESIPAPTDANGIVVPLDTKKLVRKGETLKVYGFDYSAMLKAWFVKLEEYGYTRLGACTMPDSWESLEEDAPKAMVSQSMAGETDEQIAATRERATAKLKAMGYEVVDTLFTEEAMDGAQVPLHFLAKSLESMSSCRAAYFCKGWEKARGCRIEHDAAAAYGLEVLYED